MSKTVFILISLFLCACLAVIAAVLWRCRDMKSEQSQFILPHGVACLKSETDGTVFHPREGYCSVTVEGERFTHKYVASVSTERCVRVIEQYCERMLPDTAYFVIEFSPATDAPSTVYLSPIVDKRHLLSVVSPYLERLLNDGLASFGVAWHDDTRHEEMFIDWFNTITIMTSDSDLASSIMKEMRVPEMETLDLLNYHPYAKMDLGAAVKLNGAPKRFASRDCQTRVYAGELLTVLSMQAQ